MFKKAFVKLSCITSVLKQKKGQAMVEYGLLLAFIALLVLAVLIVLGPKIAQIYTDINSQI